MIRRPSTRILQSVSEAAARGNLERIGEEALEGQLGRAQQLRVLAQGAGYAAIRINEAAR